MVTAVPATPELGVNADITGPTLKTTPLLLEPPVTMVTGPVDTFGGAGTMIDVSLHEEGVAGTPLNTTRLLPCVAPKLTPVIVTVVPAVPETGESDVMLGTIVKVMELL
jgi:hypothetical protein